MTSQPPNVIKRVRFDSVVRLCKHFPSNKTHIFLYLQPLCSVLLVLYGVLSKSIKRSTAYDGINKINNNAAINGAAGGVSGDSKSNLAINGVHKYWIKSIWSLILTRSVDGWIPVPFSSEDPPRPRLPMIITHRIAVNPTRPLWRTLPLIYPPSSTIAPSLLPIMAIWSVLLWP